MSLLHRFSKQSPLLTALLIIAASFKAYALGYGNIHGQIIDRRTGEPLIGANVIVVGTGYGVATGPDGSFALFGVPAGTQTIQVSQTGYRTIEQEFQIHNIDLISGTVVDNETGEPMTDITVRLKGSPISTSTDVDGIYTLYEMPPGTYTVEIHKPGYKPLESAATVGPTELNFELSRDVIQAEEIVVTGIASAKPKILSELSSSSLAASVHRDQHSHTTTGQFIRGKIAGIQVQGASGNPGAGYRFFMRSGGGLTGDEQPAIYLDGIRIDDSDVVGYSVGGQAVGLLADLDPEDIASIQILKGPASAASYGAEGGNGVILISSKRGAANAPASPGIKVGYKLVTGWNTRSSSYSTSDLLSANDANAIFRNGSIVQNSLNLSGSSPLVNYFAAIGNRIENGIVSPSRLNRKTVRGNFDFLTEGPLSVRVSSSYAENTIERPVNDDAVFGHLFNTTVRPESYGFVGGRSAIENIEDDNVSSRFVGSVDITLQPSQVWSANLVLGMDDHDFRQEQLYPSNEIYSDTLFDAGLRNIFDRDSRQLTAKLSGKLKTTLDHDIGLSLTAGLQLLDSRTEHFANQESGRQIPAISQLSGLTGEPPPNFFSHQRQAGAFAEANIYFKDKYSATLKVRRDYATAIGKSAGPQYYPGISLQWRLDNYKWMPNFFTLLKIRSAYGETGVLPRPLDAIRIIYGTELGSDGLGGVPDVFGNPKLKPERVKELELGLDAELFNNYSLELTYYRQINDDAIIRRLRPASTGQTASPAPDNIGRSKGQGIETLLKAQVIRKPRFKLSFTLINNWQENEITSLGGSPPIYDRFGLNVLAKGLARHEFYLKAVHGATFNPDGTYAGPLLGSEPVAMGNPVPTYTGSFQLNLSILKNISITALADWATGHRIWNGNWPLALKAGNNARYNLLATHLDLASKQDFDGIAAAIEPVPGAGRLLPGTLEYVAAANEFARLDPRHPANFIEDADFIKLREIGISYRLGTFFDKVLGRNSFLQDIHLILSVSNLFTRTKYGGREVEVNWSGARGLERGQDFFTLQSPRTYNFSLRLTM